MRDDVPSNEIVTRFRRAFDGGWYGSLPADRRRRIDLSALGVGVVTTLYLVVDRQGWLAIPVGLIFFAAARMFAFDATALVSTPSRWLRWLKQTRSTSVPQFSDDLTNAFLTAAEIGIGWSQSPLRSESGAIIVPCSRFALFDPRWITESGTVEFHRTDGDPSEGVRQTIAIVPSSEAAAREFAIAKAHFRCGQWMLPDRTYDVERLDLPTGDVEAVTYRLERHSTPRDPGPPWISHGVVMQHGRVVASLDHYRRAEPPDLSMTRSIVSRAAANVARLARAVQSEDQPASESAVESGHADLEPFFPVDDLPEYLVLVVRREPSADQVSVSVIEMVTFAESGGYLHGEQRIYRANADFYALEITSVRFRSAGDASAALKRDVEEYTRRDDYGVRSARLPEIGDESAAASGRVNLGYRGSRVASVWLRHGPVVTRFQGVMVASDPLPVVQTLAEQVAKRTG